MGTKKMGEASTKVEDDGPGVPMHIPRKSHASYEPSPMGGEGRPRTNVEAAVEYPKVQTQTMPKVFMSCTHTKPIT